MNDIKLWDELPFRLYNNAEIELILADAEHFETLVFNPYTTEKNSIGDDVLNNEQQVLLSKCKYIEPNKLKENYKAKISKGFSILNLNIRSMPKNFIKFITTFRSIDHQFDLITITETWLNSNTEKLYQIEGYTPVFLSRDTKSKKSKKRGGGVCIFISDAYMFKIYS